MSRYNIVSTLFLVAFISSLALDGIYSFPMIWYGVLVFAFFTINVAGLLILKMQYFVPVKYKGDENTKKIAITFDDGPIAGKTERLLETLRQHNVRATFFCIGKKLLNNSSLVKRMDDEGHLIGSHTFYHKRTFDLKSSSMIMKEFLQTEALIHQNTGKLIKFFRPPFGLTHPMVAKAVKRKNYTVIGWSLDALATKIKDENVLLNRLKKSVKPGDIIRFHEGSERVINILPEFLNHVKQSGLMVVSLEVLIGESAMKRRQ